MGISAFLIVVSFYNRLIGFTFFTLFQGRVNIVAKPGMKLEIPDGAVLENKVKITEAAKVWDMFFLI